jgi:hypothetical protein
MIARRRLSLPAGALAAALVLAACTPPTAPLFHDFRQPGTAVAPDSLLALVGYALEDAGWSVASMESGVVRTEERVMRRWGLYRITVSLEAMPMGERHVRVFIHPFRRFATGGQSKLFALDAGLRQSLLPPLDEAFASRGFATVEATDDPRPVYR